MEDNYLEERGIAYRTNKFEAGKKTLVFIHGLSGSCSAWQTYEAALEDKYNIVTYDLRGHGTSKKFLHYRDYAIEHFADDLAALIQHLQIEKCTLIAHSFGTEVALEFLLKHPEKVSSLICLSSNYNIRDLWRTRFSRLWVVLATIFLQLLPFSPKAGHRLGYTNFGWSPDWSLRRIAPEIKDMTLRLYLYCLRQIYAFKHDSLWSSVKVPTLIVYGSDDTFVPISHGRALAKKIAGAEFIEIKGANHMLVLNNKKELLEHIVHFTQ